MTCKPKDIIRPAKGVEYIVNPNGGTMDIVQAIMDADAKADGYINKRNVGCLKGNTKYETLRNVFNFVKGNLVYKSDRPGYEVVKSPGALFSKRKGDCKSYSITIAALLRALGFTGIRYRFVSYNKGEFTHVYVVCKLNGNDVILDAVYGYFDREARYHHHRDIPATGTPRQVAGIGAVNGTIQDFTTVVALVGVAAGIYWLTR